ncbi:hypothetical protein E2542_SST08541 [Spatholobus suberectus]|nr:hypothetical protein E2542_SST08541 [Spatholobus suberectus]
MVQFKERKIKIKMGLFDFSERLRLCAKILMGLCVSEVCGFLGWWVRDFCVLQSVLRIRSSKGHGTKGGIGESLFLLRVGEWDKENERVKFGFGGWLLSELGTVLLLDSQLRSFLRDGPNETQQSDSANEV